MSGEFSTISTLGFFEIFNKSKLGVKVPSDRESFIGLGIFLSEILFLLSLLLINVVEKPSSFDVRFFATPFCLSLPYARILRRFDQLDVLFSICGFSLIAVTSHF